MSFDREWMYTMRITSKGFFNPAFVPYVKYFLDFVFDNPINIHKRTKDGVEILVIKCPCALCKNLRYKTRVEVEGHLYDKGFVDDYKVWYLHGESFNTKDVGQCSNPLPSQHAGQDIVDDQGEYTEYEQMVMDNMYQNHHSYYQQEQQDPNKTAETFYTMLKHANEPLWLWDSEAWRKKSTIAKSNRAKGNDKAVRHTGGSIGYAEYRVKMASYLEEMITKNGLEFSVDDPEVWSRVVEPNLKRTRRVYGIGSSDINYVVSGIASSSSGVTQYDTQQLSEKKIHDLEVQMEVERRSRQELEEEIRKERHERHELQQQMKEFMKKFMQRPSS
ncbi:hypothetical protein E3N88_07661 [Mikania micrantha]|uniref:Transposase-associated domain-containing protein n=1 Tax=Mikania micrantha TaxID=192012 RepID=A0A5N6PG98_9ASTR|nr:hypothetical protein E3N88_07661 [Mikania micrantha]